MGDHTGVYNVSAIHNAIACYDSAWSAYQALPHEYPTVLASLFTDMYWEGVSTGVVMMRTYA